MSDNYVIVAFTGLAPEECKPALIRAEAALREADLVTGGHDPGSVLGSADLVLRTSPMVAAYHDHMVHGVTLLTSGVAFHGPHSFNPFAFSEADWFECPACGDQTTSEHDAFMDLLDELGTQGYATVDRSEEPVTCPLCGNRSDVRDWRLEDPVLVADIALEFWNWPVFERGASPESRKSGRTLWSIDVLALLEAAVGRPPVPSWVHI